VELNVLRKKIEEARNADDVQSEFLKKIETRVNDLVNIEQLRKQEQISFIETQSRISVDYEKKWREWETKFDELEEIRQRLQNQLLEMEGTNRSAKQSVTEFEEMNQKLDRRINEITEINRLTEDRFRQDWVSFKAEDQKRWTNYALMQEEQNRERDRDHSHLEQQTSELEENVQKLMDSVNAINEETQKGMKAILSLSNELLSSYEKAIFKRK
jgi:chromosome segregation ATPase